MRKNGDYSFVGRQLVVKIGLIIIVVLAVAGFAIVLCQSSPAPQTIALAVTPPGSGIAFAAPAFDLPATTRPAWRWRGPEEFEVQQLAGRLGIAEPVARTEKGWQAGNLVVGDAGSWYFGPDLPPECGVLGDVDEKINYGCYAGVPTDAPTSQEVSQQVEKVFGGDVQVTVLPGGSARIRYLVGGELSSWEGSLRWQDGYWFAAGWLGEAVVVGNYPTIPASDALESGLRGPIMPLGGSCPETVTLVSVENGYGLVEVIGGERWLLPTYEYSDDTGGKWVVLAIAPDFVENGVVFGDNACVLE